MSLPAGKLRHKVDLQWQVQTQDSQTGAVTHTWETRYAKVPASVEELTAREFFAAQAAQSKVVAKITIRYRSDVDSDIRVLYRDRIYTVEGVTRDKDSMRESLTLLCSEGPKQG